MKTIYDFSVKDRKGGIVSLKEYANEVILIVNTATKCGFTPQYEELEKLYNGDDADPLFKYLKEQKGFAGWNMEHPIAGILDRMLSEKDPNYKDNPDIKWNFTKFLINKKGMVVARFEPTENFDVIDEKIKEQLEIL